MFIKKKKTKAGYVLSKEMEGSIIYNCIKNLKNKDNLFIGNSLSIRMLEQYTQNIDKTIRVYSNRGASGIDGLIATALGISFINHAHRNIIIKRIYIYILN